MGTAAGASCGRHARAALATDSSSCSAERLPLRWVLLRDLFYPKSLMAPALGQGSSWFHPIGPLAGRLARCPLGPVGEKVRWDDCPVAHMCRHRGAGCVHVAVLGGGGLPLLASAVKCRCAMSTHVPAAAGLGCGCALPWVFFSPPKCKIELTVGLLLFYILNCQRIHKRFYIPCKNDRKFQD